MTPAPPSSWSPTTSISPPAPAAPSGWPTGASWPTPPRDVARVRRADGGPRDAGRTPPAAARSPPPSPWASRRWSRSIPSPPTCANRCGGRPRRCSAPTSRWKAGSRFRRPPGGCSIPWSVGARRRRGSPTFRDGLRAPHRRHAAGAGGGDRGGTRSTADPHRAGRGLGRAPERAPRRGGPLPAHRARARMGDTLALGEARFVISGTVVSAPGNVGLRAAFGPRVYLPARYLEETRLLGFGARAEYEAYLRAAGRCLRRGDRGPVPAWPARRASAAPHRCRRPRAAQRDAVAKLTGYLGLVALIALLLGGIGVASAVVVFIRQRMETIAVLRCLGATGAGLRGLRLEAAAMALVGSLVGAAVGVGFQQAAPGLLADLLPVDVETAVSWSAIALGVGMGLWVALVFAALPLLSVRRVSPLAALRRAYESRASPAGSPGAGWHSSLLAGEHGRARGDPGGKLAPGSDLRRRASAWRSWCSGRRPGRWSAPRGAGSPRAGRIVWRQGIANLHRPSNQTVTVVLAIGFGAFLLGTLLLVQHNLLQQLRLTGGPARPNLVLFDIQPDQLPAVERELRDGGALVGRARAHRADADRSVKGGRSPGSSRNHRRSGDGPRGGWAFRREYRSTYRDTLVASERVVAGKWWKAGAAAGGSRWSPGWPGARCRPWATRSCGTSRESRCRPGSPASARWTGRGSSRISSWCSRRARWKARRRVSRRSPGSSGRPTRGAFQRRLAERFPTSPPSTCRWCRRRSSGWWTGWCWRSGSWRSFTLVTGALVLVGALATSRFQRVREGALLRTLGATRGAGLPDRARGVLRPRRCWRPRSPRSLSRRGRLGPGAVRLRGRFSLPLVPLAALVLGVVALTVVVGLANSREVIRRTPLEVLRGE